MQAPLFHDPEVLHLIAGYYDERPGYRVVRQRGSASWLLFHTLGGKGRLIHREGALETVAGDLVLLQPRTLHEYGVAPDAAGWEFQWVHFNSRPHWEGFLDWPVFGVGLRLIRLGEEPRRWVRERLEAVQAHARKWNYLDDMLAMNALEEILIRAQAAVETARREGVGFDPRIRKAAEHATARLGQPIGVEELARVAGLSVSRFSHAFRAETGLPPREYLERQRIARARQLLELTDLPVKTVSADVGFASEFYFSLRFKKHVGQSPSDYRKIRKAS